MQYIDIAEMILIPDFEEYPYAPVVHFKHSKICSNFSTTDMIDGLSRCKQIFIKRYNANEIRLKSSYERYLTTADNVHIQELRSELGLDCDKFWLLLLFLCDYCESLFYDGIAMTLTPLEQLQALFEAIEQAGDKEMTLTFQAPKQKKVVVDSSFAIKAIQQMMAQYVQNTSEEDYRKLFKRERKEEKVILKESPVIAYFARLLLHFFDTQPQIRQQRRKGAKHSMEEYDLVCQLIHFTKFSTKSCWLEPLNETLRAFLHKYEDYEYPHNVSRFYQEFTL